MKIAAEIIIMLLGVFAVIWGQLRVLGMYYGSRYGSGTFSWEDVCWPIAVCGVGLVCIVLVAGFPWTTPRSNAC